MRLGRLLSLKSDCLYIKNIDKPFPVYNKAYKLKFSFYFVLHLAWLVWNIIYN